jgi:hypothetical protein
MDKEIYKPPPRQKSKQENNNNIQIIFLRQKKKKHASQKIKSLRPQRNLYIKRKRYKTRENLVRCYNH